MHDKVFRRIAHVEFRTKPRDDDDGKFQPLALVNRHDAHDILAFAEGARGGQVCFHLLHLLQKAQEAEESAEICLLVITRAVGEHAQIRLPQKSSPHRADIIVVAGIAINLPDELGHADAPHEVAPIFQLT